MDRHGQMRTGEDKCGPAWTGEDRHGQVRSGVDR